MTQIQENMLEIIFIIDCIDSSYSQYFSTIALFSK